MQRENMIKIPIGNIELEGDLQISKGAVGLVLFVHGSGSSRHSPRNRFVAEQLNKGGLATLLIDLLTREEELVDLQTAHLRFDIPLLTKRVSAICNWLKKEKATQSLSLGLFGASTGAAAALATAAEMPGQVKAVVSRGGRPDLTGPGLSKVQAPTLLIVGGHDTPVIEMNEEAEDQMTCQSELVIVPGATHLFEEAGTLEEVAKLAVNWFKTHLQ